MQRSQRARGAKPGRVPAHLRNPPSFVQSAAATRARAAQAPDSFGLGPRDGDPGVPAPEGTESYGTRPQHMPADNWWLNQRWQQPGQPGSDLPSLDAEAAAELRKHSEQSHSPQEIQMDPQFAPNPAVRPVPGAQQPQPDPSLLELGNLPPPLFPTAFNTPRASAAGQSTVHPLPDLASLDPAAGAVGGPFAPHMHDPAMMPAGALRQAQEAQDTQFLQTQPAAFAPPTQRPSALAGSFAEPYPASLHRSSSAGADDGADVNPALDSMARRARELRGNTRELTREQALRGRPHANQVVRKRKPA